MKAKTLLLSIICIASLMNQGYGICCLNWFWDTDRALTLGYRRDSITTDFKALDASGTKLLTDNLEGQDLDVFEVGVQGSVLLLNTVLVTGFADFGWYQDGSYEDVLTSTSSSVSKGCVSEGTTRDYSLAAGYNFSCIPFISIAPLVGYEYNFQEIQMEHVRTNGVSNDTLSDLRYRMTWEGPWVGIDGKFQFFCVRLNMGYHYHWADWRARWLLSGDDVSGESFSDKRSANDAFGHTAFFNAAYSLFKCWSFGVGFRYQYREAPSGSVKPVNGSFADVGYGSVDKAKVSKATWESYQVRALIGCSF